jgi:hypothetical protein
LYIAGEDTAVPQLDLIIDTYVHAPAQRLAPIVADPSFARRLWPQWTVEVSQARGAQGVRWTLRDPRLCGTTEVWIEQLPAHGCVLHTFVRAGRRGRRWPGWLARWHRRRSRARMSVVLWQLKDEVESRPPVPAG